MPGTTWQCRMQIVRFRKSNRRRSVELHLANISHGDQFLGPEFGGIENVKLEIVLFAFWNDLDAELPVGRRPYR